MGSYLLFPTTVWNIHHHVYITKQIKITESRREAVSQGSPQEKQSTTGPLPTSASSPRTEGKLSACDTNNMQESPMEAYSYVHIPNRLT